MGHQWVDEAFFALISGLVSHILRVSPQTHTHSVSHSPVMIQNSTPLLSQLALPTMDHFMFLIKQIITHTFGDKRAFFRHFTKQVSEKKKGSV